MFQLMWGIMSYGLKFYYKIGVNVSFEGGGGGHIGIFNCKYTHYHHMEWNGMEANFKHIYLRHQKFQNCNRSVRFWRCR